VGAMSVLFILTISAGSLFLIGLTVGIIIDEPHLVGAAITCGFIGAIFLLCAFTEKQSNYDHETIQICQDLGGVVTKDNHCFKEGKPIEFEPGVWQRYW
jgi:hypothetical protein